MLPGPGQVVPDQEVGQELIVDVKVGPVMPVEPIRQIYQFAQTGKAIDEMSLVGLAAGGDQVAAAGGIQG